MKATKVINQNDKTWSWEEMYTIGSHKLVQTGSSTTPSGNLNWEDTQWDQNLEEQEDKEHC